MTLPVVLVATGAGAASLASLREHLPEGARLVELGDRAAAEAAQAAAPADVVLVDAPVLVGDGWLEGLVAALDSTTATVSPLLLAGAEAAPDAVAAVRAGGPPRHPRLPSEPVACRLVSWAALSLAGPLDDGFAGRCRARGLTHVVADDVLALVPGHEPAPGPEDGSGRHERPAGSLERARLLGRRALDGLSVTIDGRALSPSTAGTQVHTLALLRALHRSGVARLCVVLPPDPGETARRALEEMPDVETIDGADNPRGNPRTLIVHRPYQVTSPDDLTILPRLGHRVVVTHQDSILYHAAAYHRDPAAWGAYRRLTASALAAADLVLAFSRHAAAELVAEDLVDEARLRVVPLGADHALEPPPRGERPARMRALGDRPFLLCMGTDLRHKNRGFAIDLVAEMRARGWVGALVLAGPHLPEGGTAGEERARLAGGPDLDLGPVDEAGKAWLYERAAAVVYPTLVEGFGLVPFEAAAADTPCLFAAQASLAELFPPDAALLVPWDAAASAEHALALLADPAAAAAQVARVRAAAEGLTWDATARRMLEAYEQALRLPSAPGATAAWSALEAEEARGAAEGRYWALRDELGDTGLALVGEDGALPGDVQRALAALSASGATRAPLFATLRALRRVAGGRRR